MEYTVLIIPKWFIIVIGICAVIYSIYLIINIVLTVSNKGLESKIKKVDDESRKDLEKHALAILTKLGNKDDATNYCLLKILQSENEGMKDYWRAVIDCLK